MILVLFIYYIYRRKSWQIPTKIEQRLIDQSVGPPWSQRAFLPYPDFIMARKDLLICTILYGETAEKTLKLMHKAKSDGADVVELRVNSLSIVDVTQILKEKVLPIIVSCSCRYMCNLTRSCILSITRFQLIHLLVLMHTILPRSLMHISDISLSAFLDLDDVN